MWGPFAFPTDHRKGRGMRRTPMRRATPLRRTPRARGATSPREAPESAPTGAVGPVHGMPWPDVRAAIYARSGGRCEACGAPITLAGMEGHHRQTRRVGPDCPGNALALCGACHHGPAVHGGPGAARETGRIVSRHAADPCRVPVWVWTSTGGRRVMLDCAGGWELAPLSSDPRDIDESEVDRTGGHSGMSTRPVDNGAPGVTDRYRTDPDDPAGSDTTPEHRP